MPSTEFMTALRTAEHGFPAHFAQDLAIVEQGSRADTASDEQHLAAPLLGDVKTVAQGIEAVQAVAGLQERQAACALTHHMHQEPELVVLAVDKVDGDRGEI